MRKARVGFVATLIVLTSFSGAAQAPPNKACALAMGFGTSCSVNSKAPIFAVVEVTAEAQKDMVPIEKLRPVAEKMATRF